MSEFKGTPGPWNISRDNRSGEIVSIGPAYSEEYAGSSWIEVSNEDALLIAAAPDIINEMIPLCDFLEGLGYNVDPARAAIAKALGEEK